jgi:hypothetical protein
MKRDGINRWKQDVHLGGGEGRGLVDKQVVRVETEFKRLRIKVHSQDFMCTAMNIGQLPYEDLCSVLNLCVSAQFLFFWFCSRVPVLTAPVMILHLSLSIAILFQMPTPMFLRSSSMFSSHHIGGHPTLLVPHNVANVNILQGDIH